MPDTPIDPSADWEALHALIEAGDAAAVIACVRALPPGEVAYTISHLPEDEQVRLLEIVPPDLSADLMAHLDDTYAADIIEDLKAEQAAAIVDVMDSDEQADILSEMEDADAQAILREMSPDEASDVRERLEYASDTAGGIMITEYLVYTAESRIHAVLDDLREHQEKFANYVVQFVYVVNAHGQLRGVV